MIKKLIERRELEREAVGVQPREVDNLVPEEKLFSEFGNALKVVKS